MAEPVKNKASISVIIPVYNVGLWIEECIVSVVNQTRQFDDIIILDDGSTDDSYELCRAYSMRYNNVRLFHHSNVGLGATRNLGVDAACTEYIIFLDSDDKLERNACELLHNEIENESVDILFYDATSFGDDKYFERKDGYIRKGDYSGKIYRGSDLFKIIYPKDYRPSACLAIYRTDFLKTNGIRFPEGIYYEDNFFSFLCIQMAERATHRNLIIYDRRYRAGSITTSGFSDKHLVSQIVNTELTLKFIQNNNVNDRTSLLYSLRIFLILSDRYLRYIEMNTDCHLDIVERYMSVVYLLENILEKKQIIHYGEAGDEEIRICIFLVLQIIRQIDSEERTKTLQNNYMDLIIWGISMYDSVFRKSMLNDSSKRVGIYGVGRCTEDMLKTFEKMYGSISADVCFLESENGKKEYRGKPVYTLEQVGELLDCIIVSSSRYHKEIKENIYNSRLKVRVIDPYEKIEMSYFSYVGDLKELMVQMNESEGSYDTFMSN